MKAKKITDPDIIEIIKDAKALLKARWMVTPDWGSNPNEYDCICSKLESSLEKVEVKEFKCKTCGSTDDKIYEEGWVSPEIPGFVRWVEMCTHRFKSNDIALIRWKNEN